MTVQTLASDDIHTTASFAIRHSGVSDYRASFNDVHATLVTGDAPQLSGAVDVASLQVKNENLYGHLMSPEFFDAENHPQITFTSTGIQRGADGAVALEGDLTLRGVTQPVRATGTWSEVEADITGAPRIGIDLEAAIDRTAFGMAWNAPLAGGETVLGDDVALLVHVEFAAPAAA
ncbi:unannotated protein [freshwater metagenome]|uniref:Unannotated protein n=1 Tax=freshwater metagenome TaxID=449393 RepID=A0A6J7J713_9ZZZZ|nr:polyisoprenoid-binding protein [Actinomycetota bacterium]